MLGMSLAQPRFTWLSLLTAWPWLNFWSKSVRVFFRTSFLATGVFVSRNSVVKKLSKVVCLVDLNATDGSGNSALHLAVLSGNIDTLHNLLALGSDTDITNSDQETPLNLAVSNHQTLQVLYKKRLPIVLALFLANIYWSIRCSTLILL